jgi:mandelate racemase
MTVPPILVRMIQNEVRCGVSSRQEVFSEPVPGDVAAKRRPEMATPLLTVRAIRTVAVEVPMARPLGTSAQSLRTAPLLLIDLETEEGVTGHAYLFCYARMAPGLIATVMADIEDAVRGEPLAPVDFAASLGQRYRLLGAQGVVRMALAGFDVACWDALSLAAGLPLVSYIGSRPRPVQAYNSNGLGLMPPEQAVDEAEALLDHGFRAVKLRLGRPTAEQDLAVVRAIRRRLPDSVALMADYNQALTVTEAIQRGRGLDGEGLYWIEEPTRHDDYAGCARIAAALATPVQIGENFAGAPAMAAALSAGACDYVMPDLERIGGVTGWQRAAALASAVGIEMSSHLFPEVSAHLLAATPSCHWLEYVDWAAPILAEPLRIADGMAQAPDRPGTGVSWDQDAVKRYRVA